MEMTFKIENGMLVTTASAATDAVGLKEGARLVVVKSSNGLVLAPEEAVEQMSLARTIIDENSEVLGKLAASERMDKAKAIMDKYKGALAELAK